MENNNNERIITYVTKEVKHKLEEKADRLGLSVSAYLRYKITELVKEDKLMDFIIFVLGIILTLNISLFKLSYTNMSATSPFPKTIKLKASNTQNLYGVLSIFSFNSSSDVSHPVRSAYILISTIDFTSLVFTFILPTPLLNYYRYWRDIPSVYYSTSCMYKSCISDTIS